MSRFGFSFEERIHAEGADHPSSYDFITGMHFNSSPQIVEITGRRLPPAELPPWVFTTNHGGWTLPLEGGGAATVIGSPQPIALLPHIKDLAKAAATLDPIEAIEVGISILIEMGQRSRIGDVGLYQLAIP